MTGGLAVGVGDLGVPQPTTWVEVAVAALALAIALVATRGRDRGAAADRPRDPAGPVIRHATMTANELEFHGRLIAALGRGYEVWPQVAATALVTLREDATPKERSTFWRIAHWRVDWVVARQGRALAVVELDDASHEGRWDSDQDRDAILASCGYRVVRFQSRAKPAGRTLRRAVLEGLR